MLGICNLEKYGISVAKIAWPESITKYAEDILKTLEKNKKVLF